jgi:hypothetical protein
MIVEDPNPEEPKRLKATCRDNEVVNCLLPTHTHWNQPSVSRYLTTLIDHCTADHAEEIGNEPGTGVSCSSTPAQSYHTVYRGSIRFGQGRLLA